MMPYTPGKLQAQWAMRWRHEPRDRL